MISPRASVKFDYLRKGQTKSMELTLGEMPNQQVAKAGDDPGGPNAGVPHPGLSRPSVGERDESCLG
jgi:serine protease Do